MTWTDQLDLSAVQKAISAIAANPDLTKAALQDPAAFLETRCGVVSPVALTLTRTENGFFLHSAAESSGTGQGYNIALDGPSSEELNDDELDLVSAGSSATGPQYNTYPK